LSAWGQALVCQLYVPDPEFTDPNQTTVRNILAAMLAGRMPQASQGVKRLRSLLAQVGNYVCPSSLFKASKFHKFSTNFNKA
jgi:hypothetical protein